MPNYPPVDDYDESGYAPPLNPGTYVVKLSEVNDPEYDKNREEFYRFDFDVKGHAGNKLFERFYFDDEAEYAAVRLGKFKQFLIAVGVDPNKGGKMSDLVGLKCEAVVVNSESGGKVYNNIKEFKAIEGSKPAPPPKNDDDDLPF